MKNPLLLSTVFSIFFALTANAQARLDKPKVYLGTSHGVTASTVHSDPALNLDNLLFGYNGGLSFRFISDKVVGIQLEANFSQRGWVEARNSYSRRLNYIEMPFLTHIYMGKRDVRFIIHLGPKIACFLSDNVLINNTGGATDYQYTHPIENKFEYGFAFGLGCEFQFGKQLMGLEARGAYTLSDIFSNSKAAYFGYSRNLGLSLNLAWLFQVK
ncbi:MAG: PorT family protein [Prevotellaceae bacterium]|jgi:hypothetical protein|nr:PorT family protein [Prevotellaceae bacterium]